MYIYVYIQFPVKTNYSMKKSRFPIYSVGAMGDNNDAVPNLQNGSHNHSC